METKDIVKPIVLKMANGETYTLDFSRESVAFAEQRDFRVNDVSEKLVTGTSDLFYYSFRKNHRRVARNQTDEILSELGGLTSSMVQRLMELYFQAVSEGSLITEEELEKNSKVTVEM